jgi:hypothetical protein
MKMLHQTAEGMVWVRTDEGHYGEPADVFEIDHGKKLPPLPPGITERVYQPGVRHALVRGTDVVDGGPRDWREGDEIIAKNAELLAKKQKRKDDKDAEDKARMERDIEKMRAEMMEKAKASGKPLAFSSGTEMK